MTGDMSTLLINNRYHILKQLGEGGMGTVYLVEDRLHNNRYIALKKIKRTILAAKYQRDIRRLKQEFEVMSRLRHPNLVQVHDFDMDYEKRDYFITMEYLDGYSLVEKLHDINEHEIISIMIGCCRALTFIHNRDILHRDINPHNIMLVSDTGPGKDDLSSQVTLMDFGLSELLENEEQSINTLKGTLQYISPEFNEGVFDRRSDIFALGLTFYELITGMIFYQDCSKKDLKALISDEDYFITFKTKRLALIINPGLRSIIDRMICFHPDKRYTCMSEIIPDINRKINAHYVQETDATKYAYVIGASFVGREKEMVVLKEQLAGDSSYGAVCVYGESGIGKSRLLYEFGKYCRLNDITFIKGDCISNKYLGPFITILEVLLFMADSTHVETYGGELKKILPHHPMLKDIKPSPIQDLKTEQIVLLTTIKDFIYAYGENHKQTIVLYLDGIEAIDASSLQALDLLTKNRKQNQCLKFYFSSTTDGLDYLDEYLKKYRIRKIHLTPFEKDLIKNYIHAIFGLHNIGPMLSTSMSTIRNKVGGNPFYLQEFIKNLVATGNIIYTPNYWELEVPLENTGIPDDIKDLVGARLERLNLTHEEMKIVEIMSLINKNFTYEDVNDILPFNYNLLPQLRDAEIINSTYTKSGVTYQLAHDLIRKGINSRIKDKKALHGFIAERLEERHCDSIDECLGELALHYYYAKNREKAKIYLKKAAVQARSQHDNRKEMSFDDMLLELFDENEMEKKIDVLIDRGRLYEELGDADKSIASTNEAIMLAQKIGDNNREAHAILTGSYALDEKTHKEYDKVKRLEKAYELFKNTSNKAGMARALLILGHYYRIKDYKKSIEYYTNCMKIARKIDDDNRIGTAYCSIADILVRTGDFDTALSYAKTAVEYFNKCGEKRNTSVAYSYIAGAYYCMGEYAHALTYYDKAITLSQKIGFKYNFVECSLGKIEILLISYNIKEANRIFKIITKEMDDIISAEIEVYYNILKARLLAAKKQQTKALNVLRKTLDEYGNDFAATTELYYEIWKISRQEEHRILSLEHLKQKMLKTPHVNYKKMIKELEHNPKNKDRNNELKFFYE